MPKKMHAQLERTARSKGLTGKAKDRYVYGTMAKQGKADGGKVTVASIKKSAPKAKRARKKTNPKGRVKGGRAVTGGVRG